MPQYLAEFEGSLPKLAIKVAFFDVDGTLLDRDGRYSDHLKTQIARIQDLGIHTAIASGRPHFAARFLMDDLGLSAPGVFCTGAQIYSPDDGRTLLQASLPREGCQRLLTRLRQLPIYYELYGLDDFYIETDYGREVQQAHAHHLRRAPRVGPLEQAVAEDDLLKWVLGVRREESHDTLGALEVEFPEFAFAYAAFPACPEWRFVNVIAREACKIKAFSWLLDYYGVTADEVISFGDSHSDEIFLRMAGCGVAMGNATDEIKSVSRFVTRNAWDDGVAYALARLI